MCVSVNIEFFKHQLILPGRYTMIVYCDIKLIINSNIEKNRIE